MGPALAGTAPAVLIYDDECAMCRASALWLMRLALAGGALEILPCRAEARRALAALRTRASRTPSPAEQAVQLVKEGRHEAAAGIYTALLAKNPRHADSLKRRAEAYRCMGRYDLALADRLALTRLAPGNPERLTAQGEIRRRLWDFRGALADARRALRLDPRCASGWMLRSECERSLGLYPAALSSAARASACDPGWDWAHVVRAKALNQKGDLEGALEELRAAEALGKGGYAWAWRGVVLRKAGRLPEALEALRKASALQPTNAWVLALRGETRRMLGDADGGLADLLRRERPRLVLIPHAEDANSTHRRVHGLAVSALSALGPDLRCAVAETEYWATMPDPNLMVETPAEAAGDLVAALSFHQGEIERNPYHVLLPCWLADGARRGAELVGGQGGSAPAFRLAALYRLSAWNGAALERAAGPGRVAAAGADLPVIVGP